MAKRDGKMTLPEIQVEVDDIADEILSLTDNPKLIDLALRLSYLTTEMPRREAVRKAEGNRPRRRITEVLRSVLLQEMIKNPDKRYQDIGEQYNVCTSTLSTIMRNKRDGSAMHVEPGL